MCVNKVIEVMLYSDISNNLYPIFVIVVQLILSYHTTNNIPNIDVDTCYYCNKIYILKKCLVKQFYFPKF